MPALAAATCIGIGFASAQPGFAGVALAMTTVVVLFVSCLMTPTAALILLIAWLTLLGTLRRLLDAISLAGSSSILLLVAPIIAVLLVIVATYRGAFRQRTPLSNAVFWLSLVVIASAANPLQGGISVGTAGLLFVLVPMLWFWIGRVLLDNQTIKWLLRAIATLAVPAALYGLFQVYRGFPWWDKYWIESKGYVALRVGTSLRQFASFASTSEYVGFLAIGMLVWVLKVRRLRDAVPVGIAVAILGWALALASARAILVTLPVALGLVFAASRGYGLARSILLGLGGLAILGAVVSSVDPGGIGGGRTSALLSRQVQGLSDPFNENVSTLPGHIRDLAGGVVEGVLNPIGQGVGSITIAAEKFGGQTAGTEADPSNIAVAAGLPGLVLYCFVVVSGFQLAFRTARQRRDAPSLVALGVLVITLFQWLNGGAYAVAPLPWLFLGWLDGQSRTTTIRPSGARTGNVQDEFAHKVA